MIDAHQVQNGGVPVVDVHLLVNRAPTEVMRRSGRRRLRLGFGLVLHPWFVLIESTALGFKGLRSQIVAARLSGKKERDETLTR